MALARKKFQGADWAELPSDLLTLIAGSIGASPNISVDDASTAIEASPNISVSAPTSTAIEVRETTASTGKGFPMRNWAQLSPDLLQSIAKRIHSYEDFLAFAGVCSSWSSAAKFVQIPLLMLAEEEGGSDIRGFSSLRNATIVHRVNLPEARGRHCIGSMGWLITVDDRGFLELLHPLTRFQIPLPRPASYEYYEEGDGQNLNSNKLMIRRAALSASPAVTKDYTLMVIFGSHCDTAFWKSGTKTWTEVEPRPEPCLDVIYYKNKFFGLVLINVFDGAAVEIGDGNGSAYFVESPGGDLLVVSRQRDFDEDCVFYTCSFKIYKFDPLDVNKCEKINDLEGAAIFVGHSGATAVSAAAAGIKPNCIYFTDDNTDAYSDMEDPDNVIGGRDMGIFNLETQTVEPLIGTPLTFSNYCPPIWVFPSL